MRIADIHPKEEDRLKALDALQILDTLPEGEFDELTYLASTLCNTPVALISFVDRDRQWFKSRYGLNISQTSRDVSFCGHAILGKDIYQIPDAKADERFSDNPLVTGDLNVAFYAGVPLQDPINHLPIGTLCVIDHKPRQLSEDQLKSLEVLKNQVQRLLDARISIYLLKQSQSRYLDLNSKLQLILDRAALGTWDWWMQSNRVEFDAKWFAMLGLDPSTTKHELATWDSRLHPDDRARAYKDIRDHLDGKTPFYENIHRLRHENGDWVWILDRGRVSERDAQGQPQRFTGIHFDLSAYKKEELISSEIQKIANIGGWELDVQSQKTKWTEQTYRIHQLSPKIPTDKIMGINFYAPHERARISECVKKCIEGVPYSEVFEFIDAKGQKKWVESTGVPLPKANGVVATLVGTFQDVTASYQVQVDLKKAQRLAKIGSWSFNLTTHELTWSSENYRIFEIDEPTATDKLYTLYRSRLNQEDLAELDRTTAQCIATGEPFTFDHPIFLDGGKRIKYLQGKGEVTAGSDGKPLLLSGTCQDITDKVLAERALDQSKTQAISAGRLAVLGEMAAGVAHEINNPLAIINALVPRLEVIANDKAAFKAKSDTILRAVARIANIVNGLRKFSKSSDGVLFHRNSLSQLMQECLTVLQVKASISDTELIIDNQTSAAIDCSAAEIAQVIIQLVNNAFDAVKDLDQRWVKIVLLEKQDDVILQVHDSGHGIDPHLEDKIFQPFFTTKAIGQGIGLGLAVCRGILDLHGATIAINREFPHTCFEIRFKKSA